MFNILQILYCSVYVTVVQLAIYRYNKFNLANLQSLHSGILLVFLVLLLLIMMMKDFMIIC